MTVFDLAVIGVVGMSVIFGFARGFVRVVISLVAWVVALVAAAQYADLIAAMLPQFSTSDGTAPNAPMTRHIVAFALIVVGVLLAGALIGWLLSRLVRVIGLGFVDRALGALLGFARGMLIVVLGVLIAGLTALPKREWWQNASLSRPLTEAALNLRPWLPQRWAERLDFGTMKTQQHKPVTRTGVA